MSVLVKMADPVEMEYRNTTAIAKRAGEETSANKVGHSSSVQYRHLIPAPVDRTSASAWL